jgi:hypothetical protein
MKRPSTDKGEAISKEPIQNGHSQLPRSYEETPQNYNCEPVDFINPEDFRISRSEATFLADPNRALAFWTYGRGAVRPGDPLLIASLAAIAHHGNLDSSLELKSPGWSALVYM